MSLQKRLLLSFLAVLLTVTIGIGVGAPTLIRNYLIETKQTDLQDQGKDLVRLIRDWQEEKINYFQFGRFINNMDRFLGARIWILDDKNRLILASEEQALPEDHPKGPLTISQISIPKPSPLDQQNSLQKANYFSPPEAMPLTNIPGGKELLSEIKSHSGKSWSEAYFHPYYKENMLIVGIPYIATRNNPGGTLILQTPIASIDHVIRSIYLYLSLSALLALFVALLLAQALTRTIAVPLQAMQISAAAMAKGDYSLRVKTKGPKEVQDLGDSLNSLARDLGKNMAEIEQQEKLRRDFIANVSHELRTPLTIMRGFSEALIDGLVNDAKEIENAHRLMRDETVRLEGLINELLDLSRLQAPNIPLTLEPIQLAEIIENVASLFDKTCQTKEVLFKTNIEEALPPILGNGDRLTQLLLIFLDNALKYTSKGGILTLSLKHEENCQVLAVSDTGSGISPEDLPYIWERFYKSDKSRNRSGSSTGLGLSIAKEIIEKHHAKAEVISTLGEGTTFKIIFPLSN